MQGEILNSSDYGDWDIEEDLALLKNLVYKSTEMVILFIRLVINTSVFANLRSASSLAPNTP